MEELVSQLKQQIAARGLDDGTSFEIFDLLSAACSECCAKCCGGNEECPPKTAPSV